MKFTKMHGAGNDFVVVQMDQEQDLSAIAAQICQRRFSVGADGLMAVKRIDKTSAIMSYYNADGSIGEMCGNGARCLAMYAYQHGVVDEKSFVLKTLSGEVKATIIDEKTVKIGMGQPIDESPFDKYFYNQSFEAMDRTFTGSYILMGVPHLTIEVEEMDKDVLLKYGPVIEKLDLFKAWTNVNFVKVINSEEIMIDTWERGAGNTLACGTGSLAAVYSLYKLGRVGENVAVHAPGGELRVIINSDGQVDLQGPAVTAYVGELDI
jgi:diaminopimelate epimerase